MTDPRTERLPAWARWDEARLAALRQAYQAAGWTRTAQNPYSATYELDLGDEGIAEALVPRTTEARDTHTMALLAAETLIKVSGEPHLELGPLTSREAAYVNANPTGPGHTQAAPAPALTVDATGPVTAEVTEQRRYLVEFDHETLHDEILESGDADLSKLTPQAVVRAAVERVRQGDVDEPEAITITGARFAGGDLAGEHAQFEAEREAALIEDVLDYAHDGDSVEDIAASLGATPGRVAQILHAELGDGQVEADQPTLWTEPAPEDTASGAGERAGELYERARRLNQTPVGTGHDQHHPASSSPQAIHPAHTPRRR